jgi:hypothetical protein
MERNSVDEDKLPQQMTATQESITAPPRPVVRARNGHGTAGRVMTVAFGIDKPDVRLVH